MDPNITPHDRAVDRRNGKMDKGHGWKKYGGKVKTSTKRGKGRRDPNITPRDRAIDRRNGHMAEGWENR